jgi:hypothetical protein
MAGSVNLQKLRVQFEREIFNTNQFKGLAQGIAQRRVNIAQGDMVDAFETHKVTEELAGGIDYSGPSIISYFNSQQNANLYSFIGFRKGTDPLEVLRELLKFPIRVQLTTRANNAYYFKVLVPTVEDIEKAIPMPDDYVAGNFSWARGIEDGDLFGIGEFLTIRASTSRSGGGIKVELKSPTGSTIQKTPYITEILEAFRVKLQELSS